MAESSDSKVIGGTPGDSEDERSLSSIRRRNWRLLVLIVILAWLGGVLLIRSRKPSESPLPREEQAAVPLPELTADLDPQYRMLLEEGLDASRRLIEAFPDSPDATGTVAMLHHLAHDKANEAVCWRRCLELDPAFARAYQWLATRATDDGNYEEAETLIRQAMAAGCSRPEFPAVLGTALMQQGKLEEAADVLKKDVQNNPRMAPSRVLLGQTYLQLKKYQEAKGEFEAALMLDPDSTRAHLGLATACTKLGLEEDAERYRAEFDRLKDLEQKAEREKQKGRQDELVAPQWVSEIMMIAGKVYLARGRLEESEQHLARAAELDPTDTECREALSAVYDRQGRHDKALEVVEQLRNLEPQNLTHLRNLGVLYGRLGQLDAAEAVFRDLCQLAPQQAVGYAGLAEIYMRKDESLSEAKTLATTAVRLQPTAWNYLILASICEKGGDNEGARAAMKQAQAIDPQNPMFQQSQQAAPPSP